ncbi:recombinase family protein [Shewanella algae]|uniref:recombinase family protein n=1 Tax=Shewanella algae TaxID=38313 RepID=UPI00118445AA|nr:recombinase family protein [Shewanella algae]
MTSQQPKVHSYVRFSSKIQEMGASVARQMEITRRWAESKGLEMSDLRFNDLGISGFKNVSRPGLEELQGAIKVGAIRVGDWVAIERLDRLSRGTLSDVQGIIVSILKQNVNIVAVADGLELTRNSLDQLADVIRLATLSDIAHKQSVEKSLRVRDAKRRQCDAARNGAKAVRRRLPLWLERRPDDSGYTFNNYKDTVELIIKLRQRGRGWHGIATQLNEEHRAARWGKGWSDTTVRTIITNHALYGAWRTGKQNIDTDNKFFHGEIIPDHYPALISKYEWLELQPKPKSKNQPAGGRSRVNPIAHVARCAGCGGALIYKKSTRKSGDSTREYHSWVCRNAADGRCDVAGKSGFRDLGKFVIQAVSQFQHITPNRINVSEAQEKIQNEIVQYKERLAELRSALSKPRAGSVSALLDGIEDAERALELLYKQLDGLVVEDSTAEDIVRLGTLADDPELFNNLLRKLVKQILVTRKGRLSYSFTVEQVNGFTFRVEVIRVKQRGEPEVTYWTEGSLYPEKLFDSELREGIADLDDEGYLQQERIKALKSSRTGRLYTKQQRPQRFAFHRV